MKTIASCTLILAAALMGGCALPGPPVRPDAYDLGPLPALASSGSVAAQPLIFGGISAPPALDGTAIIYRLLYVSAGQQPRPYARARWAEPPAQLLGARLRAALATNRPVVDVVDASSSPAPELRIELEDFSQVFEAPDQSFGVLRLRATRLMSGADGVRRIEQRSFAARVPAPSNDAAGGTQALKMAADQVVEQVVAWINSPAGH